MSRPRPIYPSISHLPGSRPGQGDLVGAALQPKAGDLVYALEKLDGSNVGIVRRPQGFTPVIRAGYAAAQAPRAMHRLFACWAQDKAPFWLELLQPGEVLIGEWLLLAHGTRYVLPHAPFVALDILQGPVRLPFSALVDRFQGVLPLPALYAQEWREPGELLRSVGLGKHGAQDLPEGFIYRHERGGKVLAVRKWVRPDYQTARYFVAEDAVLPNGLLPADLLALEGWMHQLGLSHFAEVAPRLPR